MKKKSEIRLRVWIEKGDKPFIGPGRITLLENIATYGSISKAAAEVDMSYRKAWQLIRDMNASAGSVLVDRQIGGKTGGGAVLTDEGQKVIKQYRQLEKEIDKALKKYEGKMTI